MRQVEAVVARGGQDAFPELGHERGLDLVLRLASLDPLDDELLLLCLGASVASDSGVPQTGHMTSLDLGEAGLGH